MPDVTPEAQTIQTPPAIRADIAKMVGLDPEQAATIANERGKEAEVLRKCRENASKTYDELKTGQEVGSLSLGAGELSISPIDNTRDLLPNLKKRTQEINPPPPGELIEVWLDEYASKALSGKEFEVAAACYNYITDENLGDAKNAQYIEKMASAATTPDEKYDLYLALQQILPQTIATEEPKLPQDQMTAEPQAAPTPVSAESIAADEAAWRAAAGISSQTDKPETPINAPLQPDASILSYTPPAKAVPEVPPLVIPTVEPLPQTSGAEAPPVPAAPQPTPIRIDTQNTKPQPVEIPTDANGRPLRPVPKREDDAARGLIDDIPTTPSISSSEAELAA